MIVTDLKSETRFEIPALLRDHGVNSGVSVPIAGRDGRAYGVLGAHTARRRRFGEHDVAFVVAIANLIAGAIQRRQADQRHELMIRELRHRSGNLFAQLLALFSQTSRTSRSVADLTTKYEARVLALANAHRLITEGGWQSTSLQRPAARAARALHRPRHALRSRGFPRARSVLRALLSTARACDQRQQVRQPLGRPPDAGPELDGRARRSGVAARARLEERGGPLPKRVRRAGFGTRLIGMVIERQLGGSVTRTFGPKGIEAKLVVPLSHERWPGEVAGASAEGDVPLPGEPDLKE